jgi:hypothetical protein
VEGDRQSGREREAAVDDASDVTDSFAVPSDHGHAIFDHR